MVDGGMVQNYNRGGPVQHFQEGSTPEAVSPAAPPIDIEAILAAYAQSSPEAPSTLTDEYNDLLPLYKSILGSDETSDASRNQMLLDIGQAAFQYGSNVGPDGRPMQGSGAARLSQSLAPLAGKFSARSAATDKEGQAIKMLALQSAQKERAAAQALELERRQNAVTPMSAEQKTAYGIIGEQAKLPWVMTAKGPDLPGGYPTPSTVPSATNKAWEEVYKGMATGFATTRGAAQKSLGLMPTIDALLELSPAIGSGFQQEVLARLFPGSEELEAETAYINLVSSVLPQMRAPGSGAQSDKDIEVLRLGFGSINQTPRVRELTLQALKDKAIIDGKRLTILDQLGQGEGQLGIQEVQNQLNALAVETVLSPELKEILSGILGKDRFDSAISSPVSTKTDEEILAALTQPPR